MFLQWKDFYIDLASFYDFLQKNVSKADGIVADSNGFTIVEKEVFSVLERDTIMEYYSGLNEQGELNKVQGRKDIEAAIRNKKEDLVDKDLSSLTRLEKKLLLNLPLTDQDILEILN